MASTDERLAKVLAQPFAQPVYYFAGAEEQPLREAARRVRAALLGREGGAEVTRVDGPAPDLGEVIAAAGAISFFGTPRVVELREIAPASMKDKDAEELALLFGQLENSVLLVTALYKDKRAAQSKKAKALFDAAGRAGFAAALARPTARENLAFLAGEAERMGAGFAPGAAQALLERAGEDRALLQSEVEKLAALCGYGVISREAVHRYGAHNIEADVFSLARQITGGRPAAAQQRLAELLALKHEPMMIAGALGGTFTDMLRVRAGLAARRTPQAIARDFGYTSEYRMQKAQENAAPYSTENLRRCVLVLEQLDRRLKSSALHDKGVLLQAAVAQLALLGKR